MTHVVDETLTRLQVKVYAAIREAWVEYGMSPSHAELRNACFPISLPTVSQCIRELKRKGYITAPKHQARAARPTDPERTISREPLTPWDDLTPPRKYFRYEERKTNR